MVGASDMLSHAMTMHGVAVGVLGRKERCRLVLVDQRTGMTCVNARAEVSNWCIPEVASFILGPLRGYALESRCVWEAHLVCTAVVARVVHGKLLNCCRGRALLCLSLIIWDKIMIV